MEALGENKIIDVPAINERAIREDAEQNNIKLRPGALTIGGAVLGGIAVTIAAVASGVVGGTGAANKDAAVSSASTVEIQKAAVVEHAAEATIKKITKAHVDAGSSAGVTVNILQAQKYMDDSGAFDPAKAKHMQAVVQIDFGGNDMSMLKDKFLQEFDKKNAMAASIGGAFGLSSMLPSASDRNDYADKRVSQMEDMMAQFGEKGIKMSVSLDSQGNLDTPKLMDDVAKTLDRVGKANLGGLKANLPTVNMNPDTTLTMSADADIKTAFQQRGMQNSDYAMR